MMHVKTQPKAIGWRSASVEFAQFWYTTARGEPVPAKYAPRTRLGLLIENELALVRQMGVERVAVKMNLRGRANLKSFLLRAESVACGALLTTVPRLIGYVKVSCDDSNAVREVLGALDDRPLRLLDELSDRLCRALLHRRLEHDLNRHRLLPEPARHLGGQRCRRV